MADLIPIVPKPVKKEAVKSPVADTRASAIKTPSYTKLRLPLTGTSSAPDLEQTEKISRWQRHLPLLIGSVAFIFYAITLGHGICLANLPLTARLAGWDIKPVTTQPVLWLVTTPLQCLPASWIPTALNLFSAGWAAITLGLLARSVQLMPLNRLHIQRMFQPDHTGRFSRREAWLPPVIAAVTAGLSFSFWREATVGTGEMLDLLMLAVPLWCLFEARLGRKKYWLSWAALTWGMGMAENWAMLATLPLFTIGVLILSHEKYALRLGALTAIGGCTFAILPLINWFSPSMHWSLWQGTIESLRTLKHTYATMHGFYQNATWDVILLFALCYLQPALPFLIRLKRERRYQASFHALSQLLGFHFFYAICLLGCLWLALEPDFGPQALLQKHFNLPMPLLGLMYISALGVGYLSAHFLLIYGANTTQMRRQSPQFRAPPFVPSWSRWVAWPALFLLPVLLIALQVVKNLPAIIQPNRQPLVKFGELALQSLPARGGLLLVNDPNQRIVFQAAASQSSAKWQTADPHQLESADYRQNLKLAPPLPAQGISGDAVTETFAWLNAVAQTQPIFYLQNGFDVVFEKFNAVPGPVLHPLQPVSTSFAPAVSLTPAEFAAGEQFWDRAWSSTLSTFGPADESHPHWDRLFSRLDLKAIPDAQTQQEGEWYAAALDTWGVELQRNGYLAAAQNRFNQAIRLNPENYSARVNLAANRELSLHHPLLLSDASKIMGDFRDTRQIKVMLERCGPIDNPVYCCLLGSLFAHQKWERQAVEQLNRAHALSPTALSPFLLLAELYASLGQVNELHDVIKQLQTAAPNPSLNPMITARLSKFEAEAKAVQASRNGTDSEPDFQNDLARGDYAGALHSLDQELVLNPDSVTARVNQAGLYILLGQTTNALNALNTILATTNLPFARLNRAGIWMMQGNLAAAESDYQAVLRTGENSFPANYGLAQIAKTRHDTNQALVYLNRCLASSPNANDRAKINAAFQSLGHPAAP